MADRKTAKKKSEVAQSEEAKVVVTEQPLHGRAHSLDGALLVTLGRMRTAASSTVSLVEQLECRVRGEIPEDGVAAASELSLLLLKHAGHLQADALVLIGMVQSSDHIEGLEADLLSEGPVMSLDEGSGEEDERDIEEPVEGGGE